MKVSGVLVNLTLVLLLPVVLLVGWVSWYWLGRTVHEAKVVAEETLAEVEADKAIKRAVEEQARKEAALPSLHGWTMAEVVSRHGEPKVKEPTSGWAQWSDFAARFEAGVVVEVGLNPH